MTVHRLRIPAIAVSLALATAACSGSFADDRKTDQLAAATPQTALAPTSRLTSLPDFASLAEQYGPAVVNVAVVGKSQQVDFPNFGPNDPFGEFFRRFGQPMPRGQQQMPPQRGEGSGFIVSADGYILTNAHVVANADEVTVKTTDRREYTAKVIGVDESTDVAVIKIEAKNLPTVRIGDPSKLKPGQWVIAIGSPFGF